ncbi:hypothetical protein [Paenibacillus sediminis]|uniref:Uncharacterized protein n=1 Tax=Paenibacillus sediminis TaxID=664909 RepID=A0ABS4H420_9BACL|nr:hypothetical protein [Paenibacillus sediminis]MBP1937293.1 hypothetical protein [Paenibacillus sediminis]
MRGKGGGGAGERYFNLRTEDGATYEDELEKRLIEVFRKLDDYDKNEIIEFIRVKINLRSI